MYPELNELKIRKKNLDEQLLALHSEENIIRKKIEFIENEIIVVNKLTQMYKLKEGI